MSVQSRRFGPIVWLGILSVSLTGCEEWRHVIVDCGCPTPKTPANVVRGEVCDKGSVNDLTSLAEQEAESNCSSLGGSTFKAGTCKVVLNEKSTEEDCSDTDDTEKWLVIMECECTIPSLNQVVDVDGTVCGPGGEEYVTEQAQESAKDMCESLQFNTGVFNAASCKVIYNEEDDCDARLLQNLIPIPDPLNPVLERLLPIP